MKQKKFFILLMFLISSIVGASEQHLTREDSLISAAQLKALINKKTSNLVILAVANVIDYRLAHIPGSFQVWRKDYSASESFYQFGGMAAGNDDFTDFARKLGINQDSIIVLYDHKYDATRLWWQFFVHGKKDVKVLDGGMQAWKAAGFETQILAPDSPQLGNFTAKRELGLMTVTMDEVHMASEGKSEQYQIWDTREEKEWSGKELKKGAFRKGRIPKAKFLNWKKFRDMATGKFKTPGELKKVIQENGMDKNKKNIFYCQSGVRTTQEIFALYLLGWPLENLLNYDGSWIEWSYHNDNKVVLGK